MNGKSIIITGVSGSGKTTIGKALAAALQLDFYDADAFHSAANIAKMQGGIPLDDTDRIPWLEAINQHIRQVGATRPMVLACSALKTQYRRILTQHIPPDDIMWVHLQGDYDIIYDRLIKRTEHYMSAAMLRSQFDTYEPPEDGLLISIHQDITNIIQQIISAMNSQTATQQHVCVADVGLIGLGVMGTSLARNIAQKGFSVALYNRHLPPREVQVAHKVVEQYAELQQAYPFDHLPDFIQSLQKPRKIILLISAGEAVDDIITQLSPLLDAGDIIVDGGNSHYQDTERRQKQLIIKGIALIGTGVSGGEAGALESPSIMPGGSETAFNNIQVILQAIAAKNEQGEICCNYMGTGGAGHFIKMVHNGIEYAEMQLIAEIYSYCRYQQGQTLQEIADLFTQWNREDTESYLLQITSSILKHKDSDGLPLIDKIADVAANKGTGSWTTIAACEAGVPIPAIAEALFARYTSAWKAERTQYHKMYKINHHDINITPNALWQAYMFARIMNHHQGLALIQRVSAEQGWGTDLAAALTNWTSGCIIRSQLLHIIKNGLSDYDYDVMRHPYVQSFLQEHINAIHETIINMIAAPQALPVLSACLAYFKQLITLRSNAYLIQAQRDYFGAHTYQRVDDPDHKSYHTNWSTS